MNYTINQLKLIRLMIKLDFLCIEYDNLMEMSKTYINDRDEEKLLELNKKIDNIYEEICKINKTIKKINNI
jgi:hypothetical protein